MTMPTILTQKTTLGLAEEFCSMVTLSRNMMLKPLAALAILELDGLYCGALLTLYAAQTHAITGKLQTIPLIPYFYNQDVALYLETMNILINPSETRRMGMSVTWYEISETLI